MGKRDVVSLIVFFIAAFALLNFALYQLERASGYPGLSEFEQQQLENELIKQEMLKEGVQL